MHVHHCSSGGIRAILNVETQDFHLPSTLDSFVHVVYKVECMMLGWLKARLISHSTLVLSEMLFIVAKQHVLQEFLI